MAAPFPTRRQVWNRAILGGIVTAVKTAETKTFACFEGWSGNHYVLNGVDGREGIITFAGGHWYPEAPLVAVFHDVHSKRYRCDREINLARMFVGCPTFQRALADQVALYHLELEGRHRVTAAFWNVGKHITGVDSWKVMVKHGASLIENGLLVGTTAAVARFTEGSGLSAEQAAFCRSLYERKFACPPARIILNPDEVAFLDSTFVDRRAQYEELDRLGFRTEKPDPKAKGKPKWWASIDPKAEFEIAKRKSREMLAEIGIVYA